MPVGSGRFAVIEQGIQDHPLRTLDPNVTCMSLTLTWNGLGVKTNRSRASWRYHRRNRVLPTASIAATKKASDCTPTLNAKKFDEALM